MKRILYRPNVWTDKTFDSDGSIVNANAMNNIEGGITALASVVNHILENPPADGAVGPEGPKGDKGEKGDRGETGPQGPKGDTPDMSSFNTILNELSEQMDNLETTKINKEILTHRDEAGYDNVILTDLSATFMLSNGYTVQQFKDRIDKLAMTTNIREISLGVTMVVNGTSSSISHGTSNPEILHELIPYIQNKGINIISIRNMCYSTPEDKVAYIKNMKHLLIDLSECMTTYQIKTLFISNEQKTITDSNKNLWIDIITSLKNNGITTGVSMAAFGQNVCFLDEIDIIGYNFYIGLEGMTSQNSNEEILDKFRSVFKNGFIQLCEIKDLYDKPMVLTEFGCGNRQKSMQSPTKTENTGEIDLIAQKKYLEVATSYFGQINYKGKTIFESLYIWLIAPNDNSQYDFTLNPYALEVVEKLIRNRNILNDLNIESVSGYATNFSTRFSSFNLYNFLIKEILSQNMRIRDLEQQMYIVNRKG